MDPQRDDHDRARRHVDDPAADEADRPRQLDPTLFATHHFALDDTMAAYDTFADAATTDALKVVLSGAEVAVESTSPVAALAAV